MAEVLRLDGVWTAFDRGWVLEDVSLTVLRGEIAAVVGGGGQGKTTLIRLATGTLPATRGQVLVNRVDVAELKDREVSHLLASEIGVVTTIGPPLGLTVREYVETAAAAPKERRLRWGWRRRWSRRDQRRMTVAILEELGIAECADQRWEALSDWQRVLAELAQATVVRPRLLLIDDVAAPFELGQKQTLMGILEEIVRDLECGVLMAVSDDASALRAAPVWRLHRRGLRGMVSRTPTRANAPVIPLRRDKTGPEEPFAGQERC